MRSTSGTLGITLEDLGHASALDVEIDYVAEPGEPMIMNPPDKAYPGSPPTVELDEVWVTKWYAGDDTRIPAGQTYWVWRGLELLATAIIERDWETIYGDLCLEDAAEQETERKEQC